MVEDRGGGQESVRLILQSCLCNRSSTARHLSARRPQAGQFRTGEECVSIRIVVRCNHCNACMHQVVHSTVSKDSPLRPPLRLPLLRCMVRAQYPQLSIAEFWHSNTRPYSEGTGGCDRIAARIVFKLMPAWQERRQGAMAEGKLLK